MTVIERIRNILNLAKLLTGANGEYQFSIQTGETVSRVRFMQNFGMVSEPPKNSTALLAARGGAKDASVALVVENRDGAVTLAEGETVVYNNSGVTVHLKKDGTVEIKGANLEVTEGYVQDDNTTGTETMQKMRDLYNTHTHNETGSVTAIPNQQM
jgi:phage baseplate assembly protein V